MLVSTTRALALSLCALALFAPGRADAQGILGRARQAVQNRVQQEANFQVNQAMGSEITQVGTAIERTIGLDGSQRDLLGGALLPTDLRFEDDSSELTAGSVERLQSVIAAMTEIQGTDRIHLQIEGVPQSGGRSDRALAEERAMTVIRALEEELYIDIGGSVSNEFSRDATIKAQMTMTEEE